MEVKITNLVQFGNGWAWTQTDAVGNVTDYRTNQHGEGVWKMEVNDVTGANKDFKQILGNTQFQASANRTTARNQIKRFANQ